MANPNEKDVLVPIDEEAREKYSHLLSLPPHASEVFIGGLPKDVGEEDLRDLCEAIGEIFEVRLMKDGDSGDAFVAFKSKDVAQKAIEELHSKECSLSETKNGLFIRNIPKSWTEDKFRKVIEDVGPGAENIELIKDPKKSTRNRGFAFVLYYNNACADYSRQKMMDSNFKLEGNAPTVTWADPKKVKALYVKNIPEKYEINGQPLEGVLAKPHAERKPEQSYSYGGFAPPPYGNQPVIYGGRAMPRGMQMAEDPNRDRDSYVVKPEVAPFDTLQHLIRDFDTLCLNEEFLRAHQQLRLRLDDNLLKVAGQSFATMKPMHQDTETLRLYDNFMSAQKKFLDKVEELAKGDAVPVARWAGNLEGSASRIKPEPEEPLENETKGKAPHWEPFEIMEQETTEIVGKIKYQHNKKKREKVLL
ncbi:unnamed protein product [Arabis nemorensis]|uniref:RRM domain-containing protein n=1 Tax=Arabis nemorensis TaxID=586526 RepID=A0A565BZR8_9BRAS|nr:unnamed protein product [Arabis nemorensis]